MHNMQIFLHHLTYFKKFLNAESLKILFGPYQTILQALTPTSSPNIQFFIGMLASDTQRRESTIRDLALIFIMTIRLTM